MFRASIFVTGITLFGSALGLVVQLILAHHFGAGIDVDAYLFALAWPTFLAGMVSSFLSYVAIPKLVACEANAAHQRDYFFTSVYVVGTSAIMMAVAGLLLGRIQASSLPADASLRTYPALFTLVHVGWLICGAQICQAYLLAALHAKRLHITSTSLGLLPYIGMIVATASLAPSIGVLATAVGMLLGTLTSAAIAGLYLRGRFASSEPRQMVWAEVRALFAAAPYAVVALSCFSIYSVVDAYWAPRAGEGALASLGYSQRLVIAIGNLAVAGPSAILVPRITELVLKGDRQILRHFLRKTLMIVAGVSMIFAAPLALFPELLVRLLFARGSFSTADVAGVANTLAHMTPGMVCMLLSVISLRALFCIPGTEKTAALLGGAWGVLYFATSAMMVDHGAPGLATAYSATWAATFAGLIVVLFRKSAR